MIELLTILTLLALAGGGFLVVRRLMTAQQPVYPPMEMPWQSPYGPQDDYGRSFYPPVEVWVRWVADCWAITWARWQASNRFQKGSLSARTTWFPSIREGMTRVRLMLARLMEEALRIV